jgi:hypothetical protein
MKQIKHTFVLLIFLGGLLSLNSCKEATVQTSQKEFVIEFDTTITWRGPYNASGGSIQPDYFLFITWKSSVKDAAYRVMVEYSTANPEDNRAEVYSKDSPLAEFLDQDALKSYTGTSLLIKDYQRDFAGPPNQWEAELRNEKIYTISVGYADTLTYGSQVETIEITRFFKPTTPHSEGDVIRPPLGGR